MYIALLKYEEKATQASGEARRNIIENPSECVVAHTCGE